MSKSTFYKALFSLDREALLQHPKITDFTTLRSENGHGLLFTFLRRFNDLDWISEEIEYSDFVDFIRFLFEEVHIPVNKETTTAFSNPAQDFGSALSTAPVASSFVKRIDLAQLLIEHGADPNYEDAFGNLPFFFAGHYDLCTYLLDLTHDIHHINKNNENTLFYHVRNVRIVTLLLKLGLNPNLINTKGDSLALHCVRYGLPEVLDHLFKTTSLDPNYINPLTQEHLLFAVKHKKMLDILHKQGVDMNLLNQDGQNLLFTTNTKLSFVKTLLKYGLNINHQDNQGDTVLHKPNTEHLIEILSHHGFDFSLRNHAGDTVIDVYKKRNSLDLYSAHSKTIDFILSCQSEQERLRQLNDK